MKKIKYMALAVAACFAVLSASANLAAYYTFDNTSDLPANSGLSNLTWNGSSGATAQTGKFGGAAGFSGSADYWNNTFSTAGADFSDFSVSLHVKAPSTGDWTDYLSFNGGGGTLKIETTGSGNAALYSNGTPGGASAEVVASGTTDLRDGNWHQLGLISSGGNITLYVDGTDRGSVAYAGTGTITGFQLGGEWAVGRRVVADIDDVGIFNTAVTATDMAYFSDNSIPEPATLGMVVAFGGGILFIRRKLMM